MNPSRAVVGPLELACGSISEWKVLPEPAQITCKRVSQWCARYPPDIPDKSVGERVIMAARYLRQHAPPEFGISIARSERKVPIEATFSRCVAVRYSNQASCHNCVRRLTRIERATVSRRFRAARLSLMGFRRAPACDSGTVNGYGYGNGP